MKSRLLVEKRPGGILGMGANAKINLSLDIVGKRPDGYHLLDGVMQSLALSDEMTFSPAESLSLTIEETDALLPDDNNLILRAARVLQPKGLGTQGAHITLKKRIPMGAGLGGGSADAAAALVGLNALWGLGLSLEELMSLGLSLGADVPFCLLGGTARAQGVGEVLTPVPCLRSFPVVLVQPCGPLSTREVFQAYHRAPAQPSHLPGVLAALEKGDLALLSDSARNGLEEVSAQMKPEIGAAREALLAQGAAMARMTGSGSVVFGLFERNDQARRAYFALQQVYPTCMLTHTLP